MIKSAILFIIWASLLRIRVMAQMHDITYYFENTKGNLTEVTWAHAVNNQSFLDSVLISDIMMLEADVQLGQLNNAGGLIPIMSHTLLTSDLSLEMFMEQVEESNAQRKNNNQTCQGVKLDFKTIIAFRKSIEVLDQFYKNLDYPFWVNADILRGPVNSSSAPVNAEDFLKAASESFPNATLSIGWTTKYGTEENITSGSYTLEQMDEMIRVIHDMGVRQNITFPVRAGLAAESLDEMEYLLKNVTGSTLTIWSSEGDSVNVEHLRGLIFSAGLGNVFVDVPEDLQKQLRLDEPSSGVGWKPVLMAIFMPFLILLMY